MATPVEKYSTLWTQVPLPPTKRAYGIHVNTGSLNDKIDNKAVSKVKICYGAGKLAIVRDFEDPAQITVFTAHQGKVNVVTPAPNGNWVASGDDTGVVQVWSWPGMILKNTLRIGQCINDLRWSADSAMIVAGGNGATELAKAFRFDSQNPLGKIDRMTKQVLSLDFNPIKPARVALSDEDNQVIFYHGVPFKYDHRSQQHTRYPNVVRFSPNGKFFATVGSDSKIVLYDGQTGAMVKQLVDEDAAQNHTGSIFGLAWHKDSEELVTASADKTIKIWNVEQSKVVHTWTSSTNTSVDGVDDQQCGVMWSPSENPISVSLSGVLSTWSRDSTTPVKVIYGHHAGIQGVTFARATGKVFTSDLGGRLSVTDVKNGSVQWFSGAGHSGKPINILATSPDGQTLYSAGYDLTLQKHDATGAAFGKAIKTLESNARAIEVTSTGLVIVALTNGTVLTLNADGTEVAKASIAAQAIKVSPDGSELYAIIGKDISSFDVKTLAIKLTTATPAEAQPTNLAVSANGQVFSNEGPQVLPWKADFSAPKSFSWTFHTAPITTLAVSPNQKYLVSGSVDKSLIIWKDLVNFKGMYNLVIKDMHPTTYLFIDFVDDETLISVSQDGVIRCSKITAKL